MLARGIAKLLCLQHGQIRDKAGTGITRSNDVIHESLEMVMQSKIFKITFACSRERVAELVNVFSLVSSCNNEPM
jgi:hypothetical protein